MAEYQYKSPMEIGDYQDAIRRKNAKIVALEERINRMEDYKCMGCGGKLDETEAFCATCWGKEVLKVDSLQTENGNLRTALVQLLAAYSNLCKQFEVEPDAALVRKVEKAAQLLRELEDA